MRQNRAFRSGGLRAIVAVMGVVAFTLTGCTIGSEEAKETEKTVQEDVKSKPVVSVKDGEEEVSVADPIKVEAGEDALEKVSLTNDEGKAVKGEFREDKQQWLTTEPLGYNREYTLKVQSGGESSSYTFTTVQPSTMTAGYLSPADGSKVGIGQTIAVRFDEAIGDRKAAEEAITVTTEPKVEGGFYWLSNSELRWRPKEYWEPGTKVDVEVDIYGKDLGNGYYGQEDSSTSFTIGEKVVATVDDSTKTMTIERNGEKLKSMPVSLGSATWPTPNGVYVVGDQHQSMVMDSTTYGLSLEAGGYRTPVNYATQLSWSGIYVHGAPWSVWAQGSQNTSHGCINVTDANAKWFQENTKRGDIVVVKNTVGETLSGQDGLGDWNIPWETWKKGNADEKSSW
ncbi:L,D-transpeptidase [Corynebacterium sp. H78]|uniref:L,D-transpeptidase n=1 Tax=Corynebacterium sp. H78 TaxID=3133417 RepID=UPI00403F6AAE